MSPSWYELEQLAAQRNRELDAMVEMRRLATEAGLERRPRLQALRAVLARVRRPGGRRTAERPVAGSLQA